VKCLLDTHVWIWTQEARENLGPIAQALIEDTGNAVYISPISTLEISRLVNLGRISLKGSLANWIAVTMKNLLAQTAGISHDIAARTYDLQGDFHKAPADRLLVATALEGDLSLITADERILDYPYVKTVDPRR
jgi:PIN domain nuclease of toxin-antitoxin system